MVLTNYGVSDYVFCVSVFVKQIKVRADGLDVENFECTFSFISIVICLYTFF